jgi:hypothetical protein
MLVRVRLFRSPSNLIPALINFVDGVFRYKACIGETLKVGSTGHNNNKPESYPEKVLSTGKLKHIRPGKLVEKVYEFSEV